MTEQLTVFFTKHIIVYPGVFVFYLRMTYYPKTQSLKTRPMYSFIVSVGLESRHGWTRSSSQLRVCHKAAVKVWPGGGPASQLSLVLGRSWFPTGCWTNSFSQLSSSKKASEKSQREVPASHKSLSFIILILKGTCYHFCYILFTRCKLLVPGHTRGRGWGLHQGVTRTRIPRTVSQGCLSHVQLETGPCIPVFLTPRLKLPLLMIGL